jgi:hypothetical protein
MDCKKDFILSPYWQQCYSAHSNISFSPERRADSIVRDYSEELVEDLKTLGEKSGKYEEKYKAKFAAWIGAKGRCISSMITGPANFPVRRAEKANRSESNRYEEWRHWRDKYFNAVNRERTKSPEEDLEILVRQLDNAIILNENIKAWNKPIRKFKTEKITFETMMTQLMELEMPDEYLKMIDKDVRERWFYQIGTMGPTIKRLRDRAIELKGRIETKLGWKDIEFDGGSITVEDDRVKIMHDEKPEQETINNLKRNGFRWSRYWGCWCRKHTRQAIIAAKRICINQTV